MYLDHVGEIISKFVDKFIISWFTGTMENEIREVGWRVAGGGRKGEREREREDMRKKQEGGERENKS